MNVFLRSVYLWSIDWLRNSAIVYPVKTVSEIGEQY